MSDPVQMPMIHGSMWVVTATRSEAKNRRAGHHPPRNVGLGTVRLRDLMEPRTDWDSHRVAGTACE
jgi:hypothetical protein